MPCGSFNLKSNETAKVLIGAGVGFTPLLSMLESLAQAEIKSPVTFIHCVRNAEEHAFASHVDSLMTQQENFTSHAFYSRPTEAHLNLVKTRVHEGRIGQKCLNDILEDASASEFYLCGPKNFILDIMPMLEEMGVAKNQIDFEYFGPQLQ